MVSYKKIMKSAIVKKPIRSVKSSFSTFRQSSKASLPFKLKFESSAICNLKCKMCPLNDGLKRKQGFLNFKNFKNVFDQIKPAYLNLTGIGEPLLNPDIFKIVKYGKKRKAMVKFDTNGTLLNKENINNILNSGIDILSISIDGTNKKDYEKIRKGSNFEQVKKNIKNLVYERNKRKSDTKIHMFFVLQKENVVQLPKFIKLAEELGVDYAAGSFVVTLGKNKNKKTSLVDHKKDVKELIKKTRELVKNSKVEITVDPLLEYLSSPEKRKNYNEKTPCYMPWYSTYITWDGYVNPCDFSCDNEVVFGNVFKENFKKIWNNEKSRNFRMKLLNNRPDIEICKGCSVDETYIKKEIDKVKKIPLVNFLIYKQKKK